MKLSWHLLNIIIINHSESKYSVCSEHRCLDCHIYWSIVYALLLTLTMSYIKGLLRILRVICTYEFKFHLFPSTHLQEES